MHSILRCTIVRLVKIGMVVQQVMRREVLMTAHSRVINFLLQRSFSVVSTSNLFGVYLDLVDGLQTSGCGDKIGAGIDTPHGRDIGRLPGRPKALFTEGDPPSEESRRVVDSCEDVDFLIFCCFLG